MWCHLHYPQRNNLWLNGKHTIGEVTEGMAPNSIVQDDAVLKKFHYKEIGKTFI
jgi:hypothetical protein